MPIDRSRNTETWRGGDKDVSWEVVHWKLLEKDCWNTYLYILKPEYVKKLWTNKKRVYDWENVFIPKTILEDLDWNGGQTYYHQVVDNGRKHIKVGDDYQHSWDEGKTYDEAYLSLKIENIAKELKRKLEELCR